MARLFRNLQPIKRYLGVSVQQNKLPRLFSTSRTQCNIQQSADTEEKNWHIYSGICVERVPVISAEPTEIEVQFQKLLLDIEFEHSKLSDHELRHREDLRLAELRKADDFEESTEDVVRISALEDEDKWLQDAKNVVVAPRTTPADETNDTQSLNRKLDQRLILLIQQSLGEDIPWVLPMGLWNGKENMRQCAERVLRETCGPGLKPNFLGNAPCGFYRYYYPKTVQNELNVAGGKIFFYKAIVNKEQSAAVTLAKDNSFKWLTRNEIKEYVNSRYFRSVNKFILE